MRDFINSFGPVIFSFLLFLAGVFLGALCRNMKAWTDSQVSMLILVVIVLITGVVGAMNLRFF